MTRTGIYGACMLIFLAASVMTLSAIINPRWISWDTTTSAGTRIHYTYGLHKRCSSLANSCEYFPQYDDCHGSDRDFCSMWRSVGFLMSFAVVLEGMTLVAYIIILVGGRAQRESGWKVTSFLLFLTGCVQCAAMAIIVFLFNHDDRFFVGWKLDISWIFCTVSWCLFVLSSALVILFALFLPSEGAYELIPTDP